MCLELECNLMLPCWAIPMHLQFSSVGWNLGTSREAIKTKPPSEPCTGCVHAFDFLCKCLWSASVLRLIMSWIKCCKVLHAYIMQQSKSLQCQCNNLIGASLLHILCTCTQAASISALNMMWTLASAEPWAVQRYRGTGHGDGTQCWRGILAHIITER